MKNFGYIPDKPDQRDWVYSARRKALPESIDLRDKFPPIYHQKGADCVPNALCGAFGYEERYFRPSRMFVWYNTRSITGNQDLNTGTTIKNGIKTMANDGVCSEAKWRYIQPHDKRPTEACYYQGQKHQILEYYKLVNPSIRDVKNCLAEGYPITIGLTLFKSFWKSKVKKTGIVKMPCRFLFWTEETSAHHAVVVVGYNTKGFICRNSWGSQWGDQGYLYLPFRYIRYFADCWTIRTIERI